MNIEEYKKTRRNQKREEGLQMQVASYLKIKHPNIIFRSDFAAGIKMTMGQAVKHKKMQYSRAYPDIFIAQPNSKFSGLYLELKKSLDDVYTIKGELRNNEHIQEQNAMLEELKERGYAAFFAGGFDNAITIIENYLKIK